MGRKLALKDYPSILAGDMSLASIVGPSSSVSQFDTLSYTFTWSGGQLTNGTIGIQYSLDGFIWHDLDFATIILLSAASGDHQLLITETPFSFARPVYTRTNGSATGTLKVELSANSKGA